MTAVILDGKHVAQLTEEQLSARVEALKAKSDGRTPVLATILVGDDPASATYVKMKGNACRRVGMESMAIELPSSTRTNDLLREIEQLNQNPDVHGILLQHPVPSQIDERACFDMIALDKDVDGVTCLGFGRMAMGEPAYGCATPQGIMRLLAHYEVNLEGLHAVVIGRSPILGKPMAMMMLEANATVTICHSRTIDIAQVTRQADILIAAVGRPEFVTGDMIRPGAVVIDVGINRVDDRLVGDVDFQAASKVASAITPVPGGVGPMTIAMLLRNTLTAAQHSVS